MRIRRRAARLLRSTTRANASRCTTSSSALSPCSQVTQPTTASFCTPTRTKVGFSFPVHVDKYHTVHREVWPDASKNYVAFTVKKRGQETMTVVSNLAHAVHRAPKMFSYYGTKDKRAITFQRVVAYRITPVATSGGYDIARDLRGGEEGAGHRSG